MFKKLSLTDLIYERPLAFKQPLESYKLALIWKITKLLSVKHTCPEFKFCTRRFGFMQIWFCMNCWLYVEKHLNGLQTEALDDMWKNTWMGYKLGHLMICGKTLEWATNWGTWWYVEKHLNRLQSGGHLMICWKAYEWATNWDTWWYVEKHLNRLQTGALDDMWKNTWMGYKLGHLMICGNTLEWATNWGTWSMFINKDVSDSMH